MEQGEKQPPTDNLNKTQPQIPEKELKAKNGPPPGSLTQDVSRGAITRVFTRGGLTEKKWNELSREKQERIIQQELAKAQTSRMEKTTEEEFELPDADSLHYLLRFLDVEPIIEGWIKENKTGQLWKPASAELESVRSLMEFVIEECQRPGGNRAIGKSRGDLGLYLLAVRNTFHEPPVPEVTDLSTNTIHRDYTSSRAFEMITLYQPAQKRAIQIEVGQDIHYGQVESPIYRITIFGDLQDKRLLSNPLGSVDPGNPTDRCGYKVSYSFSQGLTDGLVEISFTPPGTKDKRVELLIFPDSTYQFLSSQFLVMAKVTDKIEIFANNGELSLTLPRNPNLPEITALFERFFEEKPEPPPDL